MSNPRCYQSLRRNMLYISVYLTMCVVVLNASALYAEETAVDYEKQIKPLLQSRCYACHGALKQEGGLRLDTANLIKQGGDSGPAIFTGSEANDSSLIERIATDDPSYRMPPEHEGEPFHAHEIELIRKWIATGAPAPEGEQPETDVREHWSFQPVDRPELPEVQRSGWIRNPIDSFIAAGHEQQGLEPQPEASRIVLVRRLYLDLIGLPPTADEIAAAEADQSDDWYEKIVDRLLADPRYGERWARHWMDVWRYSDWWGLGQQLRNSQRHMWHWRDWIVESLNDDLAYDKMVRLMLAADELAPNDPDKLRATGFLARNYFIFNRDKWMDEVVTHVGKGILGLTFNCAKCHDHKFDPIAQEDYYKMRAFFEPYHIRMDMVPGTTDLVQDGIPRAFDANLEEPTYLFVRGDEGRPDKSHLISPGVPEVFDLEVPEIRPVSLPENAVNPGLRRWVLENHLREAESRLQAAQSKRDQAASSLNSSDPPALIAFTPIVDSFATLDTDRWQVNGGGWTHKPGKLEQRQDGPVRYELTLKDEVPQDFEAELTFQLTGGSTYRSVGIDFDVPTENSPTVGNAAGTFSYIYLSGWANDSKVQGAYSKSGNSSYPANGRKPYSVQLNQPYTINLRVRGELVNVSVNGEFVLAWRTPLPRRPGTIRLMTFDALAEFNEFQLTALDPSTALVEPKSGSATGQRDMLELAEAELRLARAELESVEKRIAAIEAKEKSESPEAWQQKRVAAIHAEREQAVAQARKEVLVATQALAKAKDAKQADAKKKLTTAEATLKAKLDQLESEIGDDDSFTKFKGAEWSATRFEHTGRDDPGLPFPQTSTGRRTALASWITDPQNPLTARVAVNHLWSRHFGAPLAPTPFDMGRNSSDPTHPELIDWLAAELIDHQWSMKHIHRLMVTSSTYRMSSSLANSKELLEKDPDNHYLWHRRPVRLESQAVRDSILSLAGTLDGKMGGPSVPPDQQQDSHRRSLYFFHSNNERSLFLSTFDEAEVAECYRREESIVPQQALAMTNSKLVLESASQIAKRIRASTESDEEFVQTAFAELLGIHPQAAEIEASRVALRDWKNLQDGAAEQAYARLIWVLLNHNDFVTVR